MDFEAIYTWDVGERPFVLPRFVSMPLVNDFGERTPATSLVTLEVHFENPFNIAGLVDRSGFAL
jgi:hypothetical protein